MINIQRPKQFAQNLFFFFILPHLLPVAQFGGCRCAPCLCRMPSKSDAAVKNFYTALRH